MKKTILVFIFFGLTFFVNAQQTKADSIAQVQANKFVDSLVNKTSIEAFKEWVYETVPAKKFDEFMQLYNSFLRNKYELSIKKNN